MSRTGLDANMVFRTKKLDAISRRHTRAEDLLERYRSIKILQDATDKNLWIVPSFSELGEMYKVRHLSLNKERHSCDMYCDDCDACVHEYSCNCPDAASNLNFCKHMHLLCLNNCDMDFSQVADDERTSETTDTDEKHNAKKDSWNLRKDRKSLRQEAKAAILGLLSEFDQYTSDESFNAIVQSLTELKSQIEAFEGCARSISPMIDLCI